MMLATISKPMYLVVCILTAICVSTYADVQIERITLGDSPPSVSVEASGPVSVSTPWFPVYAVAHRLLQGTAVTPVFTMPNQSPPAAAAVLGIRAAWPGDTAYLLARQADIRTIEIDASRPLDGSGAGVALVPGEAPGAQPPLFWLATENLSRMSEILAHDLSRLSPADAETIAANLSAVKKAVFALSSHASTQTAQLQQLEVVDAGGACTYLIRSLGLVAVSDSNAPALIVGDADGQIDALLAGAPEGEDPFEDLLARYRGNVEKVVSLLRHP